MKPVSGATCQHLEMNLKKKKKETHPELKRPADPRAQSCTSRSNCGPIKAPYVAAHIFDPTVRLGFLNNAESAYFFMSRSSDTVSFLWKQKRGYVRNLTVGGGRETGFSVSAIVVFMKK